MPAAFPDNQPIRNQEVIYFESVKYNLECAQAFVTTFMIEENN